VSSSVSSWNYNLFLGFRLRVCFLIVDVNLASLMLTI
jgi:hypothetical protein